MLHYKIFFPGSILPCFAILFSNRFTNPIDTLRGIVFVAVSVSAILMNALIARHLRQNKRKRQRESVYAKRRRRYTIEFAERLLQVIVIILVNCVFEWEDEYLSGLTRPIIPDLRFNLANCGTELTDGLEAEHLFRFSVEQIYELIDALRIPRWLQTSERDRYDSAEGLCIVLRRLVFPIRYMDMVHMFGRATGPLSRINRHMMAWLFARWHHLADLEPAKVNNMYYNITK